MGPADLLRSKIKAARKRRTLWVRVLDLVRLLPRAEGRALLWTRAVHADEVHQITPDSWEERYPDLFDGAARLMPHARRILSFGCSTGEELVSLHRRFPEAEIVGVEINARSRRIAARRIARDGNGAVYSRIPDGTFDMIFALAVLQREPHKIAEMNVEDLSPYYPFDKFDAGVVRLVDRLRPAGLLCVQHSQYRIEDSSSAVELEPVESSPPLQGLLFGRDGRRFEGASGRTIFRKRAG
jgi:hypothetical protein